MLKIGRAVFFIATFLSGTVVLPAQSAMIPSTGTLDFTVFREGEEIGTHQIDFLQKDEILEVNVKTRIAVKIAFITVFRFVHDGHEVWRDNRLVSIETKTNDDGDDHSLSAKVNASGDLQVLGDGENRTVKGSVIPASLWNSTFLESKELLNSLIGTELAIDVVFKGEEPIEVQGKMVNAKHYSMTGEFERELWYDEDQVLVKFAFSGEDGSNIQYILQ